MKLEKRLDYNKWNEVMNLIIPFEEVERYRYWLNENKEIYFRLGFDKTTMFKYYAHCLQENKLGLPAIN